MARILPSLFLLMVLFVGPQRSVYGYVPIDMLNNPPQPVADTSAAEDSGCQAIIDPVTGLINWAGLMDKIKNWAQNIALLGQIVSLVTTIYNLLTDGLEALLAMLGTETGAVVSSTHVSSKIKEMLTQALIDAKTKNVHDAAVAGWQASRSAGQINHYLCKAAKIHGAGATTEEFEQNMSETILRFLESSHRGRTEDGNGVKYVALDDAMRRYGKFVSPVDGYDKSDVSTAVIGVAERTLHDADVAPWSAMDGAAIARLPPTTEKTIKLDADGNETLKVHVLDPKTDNEYLWLAGLGYCAHLVGPTPTPPWGDARKTPHGAASFTRFEQAKTLRSAASKACADLLAYYTQPNETATDMIAEQKKLCVAAQGYLEPDVLKKKFENCQKGLSPAQADSLKMSVCKTLQHYLSYAQMGAVTQQATDGAIACSTGWFKKQTVIAAKQGALVDMVEALAAMEEGGLWDGVDRMAASPPSRAQPDAVARAPAEKAPLVPVSQTVRRGSGGARPSASLADDRGAL